MKLNTLIILLALTGLVACQGQSKDSAKNLPKPTNEIDKFSYTIGQGLGKQMKKDSLKPNLDYILLGLKHALNGDSLLLSQEEQDATMKAFSEKMMKKQQEDMANQQKKMNELGDKYKTEGPKFLEENKKKPGVKTTASGLQYMILKEGTGKVPESDDLLKVNFKGTLIDGTEFDNTYNRQPLTIPATEGLPGWKEAFKMMKTGAKWRLFLPPALGLGEKGAPPNIPPYAVLIFDMELDGIVGKVPKGPQGQMPPQAPPPPQGK